MHVGRALHLENPRRDATTLTVVEVEARFGQLPAYRTVDRKLWLGVKHTTLHAQILTLADHWHAAWIVVDATGIGAGLASFLAAARPALTSNRAPGEWPDLLGDPLLASAGLDRLAHRAEILIITGGSFRAQGRLRLEQEVFIEPTPA